MCAASLAALQCLTDEINLAAKAKGQAQKTVHEVALGFVDVANEAMCRPIRSITEARGLDASQHVLSCFGGAGGQHACAIAQRLGMQTVFVQRYASILSAVGMGLASIVQEEQVRLGLALQCVVFMFLCLFVCLCKCVVALFTRVLCRSRLHASCPHLRPQR